MKFKRIICINQVTGKLFYQLSLGLSKNYDNGSILIAGDICKRNLDAEYKSNLIYKKSVSYDRRNYFLRIISWIFFTFDLSKYIILAKKDDLILLTSNPPIVNFWLFLFIKFKKLSFVILVYDVYPNILVSSGYLKKNNPFILIWKSLNTLIYSKAIKVITIQKNMRKLLSKEFLLNADDIGVIYPWVDIDNIKPISKKNNKYSRLFIGNKKFVVLYSGNMGITHDIESILNASVLLKKYNDILFLFIGGGKKYCDVSEFIRKNKSMNIRLFEYQKDEILPYSLSLGDISLVSIGNKIDNLMLPSKFCYYLSAGSAVIGICNSKSELAKIIQTSKVGYSVKSKNPKELANLIEELYKNKFKLELFKENARRIAIQKFNMKNEINNFYDLIKN